MLTRPVSQPFGGMNPRALALEENPAGCQGAQQQVDLDGLDLETVYCFSPYPVTVTGVI